MTHGMTSLEYQLYQWGSRSPSQLGGKSGTSGSSWWKPILSALESFAFAVATVLWILASWIVFAVAAFLAVIAVPVLMMKGVLAVSFVLFLAVKVFGGL